jgi:RNA polymerase sigma-70 factor (family 1)
LLLHFLLDLIWLSMISENDHIKTLLASISTNNDTVAYKELFLLLHPRLKQFAYSMVKSHEEAEDIVAELFVKLWEKRSQLHQIESPRLYFYTSIKNLSINLLNKQKRQQGVAMENWLVQMNSIYFDPEKIMLTEEMTRQINKAVNDLPPRCKIIFKLVKEDGLRYKEVAELLQLSVKTIEAQMAIALRRIGKCMHFEVKGFYTTEPAGKK